MGSSKGGGGSIDTSGLEEATKDATALQKLIYEQTREDTQPFYQLGVGSANKLADLLGVSGGSVQSREDIYQNLLPQYTATTEAPMTNQYITPSGTVVDFENMPATSGWDGNIQDPIGVDRDILDMARYQAGRGDLGADWLSDQGFRALGPTGGVQETTDFEALNAAVDAQLAGQGTPDGYGSLLEAFGMDKFEEDPGYQYRKEEAQKALERSMAAQGVTLGGGGAGGINPQVAQALEAQSQGLASQEYGNAYNRYNIDQQNVYNRLLGTTGIGTGQTAQMAQAGQQYATNTGNLQTGLAQAQLNAQLANQQSGGSMFGDILGSISPIYSAATGTGNAAQMAAMFSDERLKENIELVGHDMGHNIYEFDYKDGSGRFRGVMAQEVVLKEPDAVTTHPSGYMMVNYDKIGLKMESV